VSGEDPRDRDRVRVRVLVSGRVQGVFFRQQCGDRARAEGVGGFVRNLMDGRVEAEFEGTPASVSRLVEWCRTGPRRAVVEAVETTEIDPIGETTFRVR
jgi:acylphosphatase